ncbi:MAG: THUMP domain-containing protein [Pyrobaculum arsenaticum]|uniref:Methyltransferase n=2 Tax=Pyrobaculum arsenaticum TaxID=121277 RepID=A0A7L4P9W6_9CREN|nr:THUMP domain-containing protein [Pyrobaculum arsenaticum]ABP50818.1 putative RNA methylase [Pyrobaculum arsenaticum DSM 13514]MCY0891185.1 THUMP domain-containing protein [Pyrobaculum arsenaticum]NYR15463.1 methyltransferase [Pyrobaculum arsenaticum]
MEYLFTTVPGLEDFVIEELSERFPTSRAKGVYMTGRVVAEVGAEAAELFRLRTVERFGIFLGDGFGEDLSGVVEIAQRHLAGSLRYLTRFTTVGVRCERVGQHGFTSRDVEREVGRWFKERGFTISLVEPDVEVNVDVVESYIAVWITVAKRSLKDRPWRVYEHYASLNPIIANAMVRLAKPKPGETVCDLTCGGGTIVAEAAELYPHARYLCVDISLRHVKGAVKNTAAFPQVDVLWFDSTKLHRAVRPVCDKFVFNPPYGFRIPERVGRLYRLLGKAMRRLARGCATYVVITPRHKTFISQVGGELLFRRVVYQGGLYSHIIAGRICP